MGRAYGRRELLEKAERRISSGDEVGARRIVDRALALPHDDFEDVVPAMEVASGGMLEDLTEAMAQSHEDDTAWLEAAVSALESSTDWGREQLAHCLNVLVDDGDFFETQAHEIRRIQRSVPTMEATERLPERVPETERADYFLSVLRINLALRESLSTPPKDEPAR